MHSKRQAAIDTVNSIVKEFPDFNFDIKHERPNVQGTFIINVWVSYEGDEFLGFEVWNQPNSAFDIIGARRSSRGTSRTHKKYPYNVSVDKIKEAIISIIKGTDKYRIWQLEKMVQELQIALLYRPPQPGPKYLAAAKSYETAVNQYDPT